MIEGLMHGLMQQALLLIDDAWTPASGSRLAMMAGQT